MNPFFTCRLGLVAVLCLIPQLVNASLIRDTELEAGLEHISAPLTRAAGFGVNSVDIRIIIDPTYNAFVAGEMTIYIHSGLLVDARSTEEILGVIAHELGHLKAGHVPRRQEAIREASGATALAAIAALALTAGGAPGDAAMGVIIGGSDQAKRRVLGSFRRDESVADELGLRLLDEAEVSSRGLAEMMRRMAAQRALPENHQSIYYQTHPGAGERMSVYNDHLAKSPHADSHLPKNIDDLARRLIDKLRAYTAAPQTLLQTPERLAPENRTYGQAVAHFRRGDLKAALGLIDTALTVAPDDPFYHEFRGDVLISMARPAAAAEAYQTAVNLRPDSPQILLNLGRALLATGERASLARAIEAITAALTGEPNWAFAYRQLAIAYGRAGKLALADLNLAQEALLMQDRQQAARMAKRALSRTDTPDDVRNRANDILFSLGKTE